MEDYPKTLAEFDRRFNTEEACRKYLYQLRWPNGFICPRCGHSKAWESKNSLFRCAGCSYKCSVTSGTIFESTRKPFLTWFRVIWWVVSQKNGASAKGLQRILGLSSYETAWTWLHKLRRAMVRPGRDRLSGKVEVDETFIGGVRSGKHGRGAFGKTLVAIAVEKGEKELGRIRFRHISDASGDNLGEAVQHVAEPGSVILTDGWKGYSGLNKLGYKHEVVRPSAALGENLLPGCNRVASLLKRWLMGTHQGAVSHGHLDYYLDEFTFRFNRRTSRHRGKLFYRLIQQAIATEAVTYEQMAQGIRGRKPKEPHI